MARLEMSLEPLDSGWIVKVQNATTYATTQHAISSLSEMPNIPYQHGVAIAARASRSAAAEAAE